MRSRVVLEKPLGHDLIGIGIELAKRQVLELLAHFLHAHAARGAALNLGLSAMAETAQALHEGAAHLPAHEVAHLREMNHSRRFWSHVKRVMPEYERGRAWLHERGSELHAIGLAR